VRPLDSGADDFINNHPIEETARPAVRARMRRTGLTGTAALASYSAIAAWKP